ncbi:MAG: hypothetical protein IJ074_12660 [Clostridia bacterium]|nr:hypothetical protein [Clostridia bacterium]MBQ8973914.1 hypothetical protein [Clostridia bacterium]
MKLPKFITDISQREPKQHPTNRLFLGRMTILCVILSLIFVAIFGRMNIMVRSMGETYAETASNKSTKSITLYGMRGTIYDTNMNPLAYDRTSYNVTFYRDPSRASAADREAYTRVLLEAIQLIESNGKTTVNDFWMRKNEHGQWVFNGGASTDSAEASRKRSFRTNFSLTNVSEDHWFDSLLSKYSIPEDIDDSMKVKILALWQESRMNAFNSTPCTIAYDVGFETVSEIEVRSDELDGIDISESSTRVYPQGTTACHVVGYISKISSTRLDEYRAQGYPNDAFIGADGIEASLENQLSPYIQYRQGSRTVERNTRGKVVRDLDYTAPQNGNSVVLTIDTDLQKVMADALKSTIDDIRVMQEETIVNEHWLYLNQDILDEYEAAGKEIQLASSGAMVAMDPNTGRVLGLVSYPDFDLSYFNGGTISMSDWAKVQEGNDPLYNRAVSAKDSPGSIFKLCTALAGLAEGAITVDTRISDMGAFTGTGIDTTHAPRCWTSDINRHRNQTIVQAIKNSCNYFFYTVSYALGATNIYKWAAALGLTSKTNIELPGETTSFVGNQDMLYDPDLPISQQATYKPLIAANAIRSKLLSVGEELGIEYDEERISEAVKKLLDISVSYDRKAEWAQPIREVLLYDLNIPASYLNSHYVGNTITTYIQELYWTANETIMLGIGQSITQVSPIAVARYVSAIANGGTVYDAQIVDKIIAPDGSVVMDKEPVVANQIYTSNLYFEKIREGMEDVTSMEDGGTAAKYFADVDYIAAKTGTSQRTDLDVENNAWEVLYAPKENPQIVVVIYIQNGYAGANCSPAGKETIVYYLEHASRSESSTIGADFSMTE